MGFSGEVGYDFNADVGYMAYANTCQVGAGAELAVSFKPWAKADAYAKAGVDIYIASAGVKGSLNLIHFETPFAANARVAVEQRSYDTVFSYSFDVSADVELEALSGALSVYVELDPFFTDPYSKEAEIFNWDGQTIAGTGWKGGVSEELGLTLGLVREINAELEAR